MNIRVMWSVLQLQPESDCYLAPLARSRSGNSEWTGERVFGCRCRDRAAARVVWLLVVVLVTVGSAVHADKPTKAEGAASLGTLAAAMRALCEDCCSREESDCDPATCRREADAIAAAILDAWNANYGKGSLDDDAAGSDSIGGYLCWDWAKIFEDAAKSTNPRCWTVKYGMARKTASRAVHYWLDLYACQESEECLIIVDDGWFIAKTLVHRPPWPGRPAWTRGTLPLPPPGRRLTPPKDDSGIEDLGALATVVGSFLVAWALRRIRMSQPESA